VAIVLSLFADLPYTIAPMQVTDINEVMVIDRQAFSTPWSHNAYHYEIAKNDAAHYLVLRARTLAPAETRPRPGETRPWDRVRRWLSAEPARSHPPILGYGGLWLMYDEAHISTVAVRSDLRGRGLGELILLGLLQKAMALDANLVTLEVRLSNTTAQRLYEKYAFAIVGRRRGYYTDNGEDALLMTTPSLRDPEYQAEIARLAVALRQRLLTAPQPTAG
jgi:[ribosomal protein S18]-alanine N-acetyltransferase